MYDHTFYKQVQISRSDIRPHIKWAVSLVIMHMVTSIFLQALLVQENYRFTGIELQENF